MESKEMSDRRGMDVALGFDDAYAGYAAVAISSVVRCNTGCKLRIHVLSDGLSEASMRLVERAASPASVIWHIHEYNELDSLPVSHWTKHVWLRVLLPDILPDIDRVLYLDADTLILDSIESLWDMDMDSMSVAGVADNSAVERKRICGIHDSLPYVCSGVLLINLDYWRQHDITCKIIDWAKRNADILRFPDQDATNYICASTAKYLPLRFSAGAWMVEQGRLQGASPEEIRNAITNPAIVHYCGPDRPWLMESMHPYAQEWRAANRSIGSPVRIHTRLRGLLWLKTRLWHLMNDGPQQSRNRLIELALGSSETCESLAECNCIEQKVTRK